ncbi:MAG: hypothetical protein IPH78_13395 [Bacteroidetes bacterium]|nr:hypothetical protein [Bacteroidota bacterium]
MSFNPIEIKKGEAPDFDNGEEKQAERNPLTKFYDLAVSKKTASQMSKAETYKAMEELCAIISTEPSGILQADMMDTLANLFEVKRTVISTAVRKAAKRGGSHQLDLIRPEDDIPEWVSMEQLYANGFVMNNGSNQDRIGIYFKGDNRPVIRLTNFTVKPLYFIMDPLNPRRLVEVYNGHKTYVLELSARAFVSQDSFEVEVTGKPGFYTEPGFAKIQYKKLVNWINENTRTVYELKTLGWQSEGFFAFTNKVVTSDGALVEYDEYGIAEIAGVGYLSPSVGKLHLDVREEDSIYENDRYLQYHQSPVSFQEWARMFCTVYDDHAPFGLAFLFIAMYKDVVSKVTKIPIKYFYGPKGSGKSAMAESMMWFFFSGKNSDGKLIQGYNLNPGQGTHFSFFSRLQRFRNVFMLYNEHDPTVNEPWKRGAFKASYDGEGREVGTGDSGKKRKTEIQKVQCVLGLAGQYLDTQDDGALLSRSVPSKFSLEKNKHRTDEQKAMWQKLTDIEHKGISSLVTNLLTQRNLVQSKFKEEFWAIQSGVVKELRSKRMIVEARLLNNYCLCMALIKILEKPLSLPFTYDSFYNQCIIRLIEQARLLKDNNILTAFWNTVEVLLSDSHIRQGYQFDIRKVQQVSLKEDGERTIKHFVEPTEVVYLRLNLLHDKYAKRFREITGKQAPDTDTVATYLKDQPYFIGLCPGHQFKDMNTSCYLVNYTELKMVGVVLEKLNTEIEQDAEEVDPKDLPF